MEPPSEPPAARPPAARRVPPLAPVQVDTGQIIAAGTGAFFAAFALLGVLRLIGNDWVLTHPTWLWTSLAGGVLGLLGLLIVTRHRREGRTK